MSKAFPWQFTSALLIGSTLNPINSSLIATALVPIAQSIHVPVGQTAVLVSALYLASAIAQPTAGKLAEEFGPRRVFIAGIIMVFTGGIIGTLAQDLTALIVSRVLIGLGTSTGYPTAMLLIRRRTEAAGLKVPPGYVLGSLVIAGAATVAVGLPIGGVLVDVWGWRTTFLINVPFAMVAFAMAMYWIPHDTPIERTTAREVVTRIDLAGILGFATTIGSLLIFLMSLPRANWISIAISALAGAALVAWELRTERPFFDLRLLTSNLALTRTYLRFAIAALCVYTVLYGIAQWLEAGRAISAREAGLLLLPMSVLSAVIIHPVSQRHLVRLPLILAAVSCLAGSLGVLFLTGSTPIAWIIVVTLIFGITLGTTASANQTTLYAQAAANQIGTASGLFRTFGYIGSIASSAIISVMFHSHVSDDGLHNIAAIMIAVSIIAALLTVLDRNLMRQATIRREH